MTEPHPAHSSGDTDARSPRRSPRDARPCAARHCVRLLDRSGQDSALDGYGGADRAALRWDLSRQRHRSSFCPRLLPRGGAVHRLAYSFGWDGSEVVPPGFSLVEIDLLDEQPEGTLLRLTHTGLPSAEQCASHAEGWAHYLDRLVEVAAGRDPGPDLGMAALAMSDWPPRFWIKAAALHRDSGRQMRFPAVT